MNAISRSERFKGNVDELKYLIQKSKSKVQIEMENRISKRPLINNKPSGNHICIWNTKMYQ